MRIFKLDPVVTLPDDRDDLHINDDDNVIEDADVEDKGTIFSEEFDPKKREGVVNLKNDKVFTYIQVDNNRAKLYLLKTNQIS